MSKILKLFMMLLLVAACSEKDNREELTITDSEGNKTVYKVELAQSKEQLVTGLMNRTALDADAGMIFDLSGFNNVPTAMWMKDTKIALDMLFIDQDGMIYWIFENAEPDSVKMIVAPYPAAAVLEVNAGDAKAKGIKIGDMVEYKLFSAPKAAAEVETVSEKATAGDIKEQPQVEAVAEENKPEPEMTDKIEVEPAPAETPIVKEEATEEMAVKEEVKEETAAAEKAEPVKEEAPAQEEVAAEK